MDAEIRNQAARIQNGKHDGRKGPGNHLTHPGFIHHANSPIGHNDTQAVELIDATCRAFNGNQSVVDRISVIGPREAAGRS